LPVILHESISIEGKTHKNIIKHSQIKDLLPLFIYLSVWLNS